METTLHRQLKELYADDPEQREVAVDGYRIDAVREDELVEVQSASLSAIQICGDSPPRSEFSRRRAMSSTASSPPTTTANENP